MARTLRVEAGEGLMSYWATRHRVVTELGQQGCAIYAQDQFGMLWYRFDTDKPEVELSWKMVAT